jgi:N-acetylmuramoyl-L-alanine amidase
MGLPARLLLPLLLLADLASLRPAWASSLAAWRLTGQGVLELRTSVNINPLAFYEAGAGARGPRVWIDLPGAPSRSRSVNGSGDLRQVRIGQPDASTTRLVLEFAPGVRLDPGDLRLVGTARDRWKMEFKGIAAAGPIAQGEGSIEVASRPSAARPWTSANASAGAGANASASANASGNASSNASGIDSASGTGSEGGLAGGISRGPAGSPGVSGGLDSANGMGLASGMGSASGMNSSSGIGGWRPQPRQALFPTAAGPLSADGLPLVPRGRFKVVIDPGHGGPDPGAVGIAGLRETDVVLDVSLQLARLLQSRGVEVLLTRTTEVDVDLPPRVALANSSGADVFLSVHANALSMMRPDVNGIESFYFEPAGNRARSLAAAVQQQMLAISPGSPDRGVRTARFFVIRRTVMPSTLVEMGFVTGALDAPRLMDANFRRRMAVALATGVLTYLPTTAKGLP